MKPNQMSGWSPKRGTGTGAGGPGEAPAPIRCWCRGASDPRGSCSSTRYPRHARCLLWAEPQTRRFWLVRVLARGFEFVTAAGGAARSPGWWVRQRRKSRESSFKEKQSVRKRKEMKNPQRFLRIKQLKECQTNRWESADCLI